MPRQTDKRKVVSREKRAADAAAKKRKAVSMTRPKHVPDPNHHRTGAKLAVDLDAFGKFKKKPEAHTDKALDGPLSLSSAKKKEFLDEFYMRHGNIRGTCRAIGISSETAYEHYKTDPEFRRAWDEIVGLTTENLEQEAYRRAYKGVERQVYYQGEVCGQFYEYSDTMTMFLLKGRRPEMYMDRASLQHSGVGGGPIQAQIDLSRLSQEELDTLENLMKKADGKDADDGDG